MALKSLINETGANGHPLFAIPTPNSDSVNSVAIAASVAESITIPSGAKFVIFSANCDFFANYNTTATVPGDVTNGSASELNPVARKLDSDDTISVISADGGIVTATFYK